MTKNSRKEKKQLPLPICSLLFHTGALLLFALIELLGIALGDTMQNIAGAAVFFLTILYAVLLVFWTIKTQSPMNWGRSLLTLLAFFGIGAALLLLFGIAAPVTRRPPLAPGTPPAPADLLLDIFLFGWLYLLFDSPVLLLSFLVRWIAGRIKK